MSEMGYNATYDVRRRELSRCPAVKRFANVLLDADKNCEQDEQGGSLFPVQAIVDVVVWVKFELLDLKQSFHQLIHASRSSSWGFMIVKQKILLKLFSTTQLSASDLLFNCPASYIPFFSLYCILKIFLCSRSLLLSHWLNKNMTMQLRSDVICKGWSGMLISARWVTTVNGI